MTTRDTVFKFKDKIILLEDLEKLYNNEAIDPDDIIKIAEKPDEPFVDYTLDVITYLYGEQYPFRRQRNTLDRDPLTAYSDESDVEAPKCTIPSTVGGGFPSSISSRPPTQPVPNAHSSELTQTKKAPRPSQVTASVPSQKTQTIAAVVAAPKFSESDTVSKSSKVNKVVLPSRDRQKKAPLFLSAADKIYIDHPLCHVEPADPDSITGEEVISELQRLEKMCKTALNYKKEVKRTFWNTKRDGNKVAVCRLCPFSEPYTPYTAQLFIDHLFKPRKITSKKEANAKQVENKEYSNSHASESPIPPTTCALPSNNVQKSHAPTVPLITLVEPLQCVPRTDLTACELPLFNYHRNGQVQADCLGPTLEEINLMEHVRFQMMNNLNYRVKCFVKPTQCSYCQVDISDWTAINVAVHAFSVEHLKKVRRVKHKEEYQYWIFKIQQYPALIAGYIKSRNLRDDVIRVKVCWPPAPEMNGPEFTSCTNEDYEYIDNFDDTQLTSREKEFLIHEYGACIFCNEWILDPVKIIMHYLNDNGHSANVKSIKRTVRRAEMSPFLQCLRNHQKRIHILKDPDILRSCEIM
ncbi:unnamed protein product [Caenorhabditis sp. 36 PRJEB53466]|nr:unnamed protein product [Caenorhabditis sp. 36 PRJEB53466]